MSPSVPMGPSVELARRGNIILAFLRNVCVSLPNKSVCPSVQNESFLMFKNEFLEIILKFNLQKLSTQRIFFNFVVNALLHTP